MTKTGKKAVYVTKETHRLIARFAKHHEMELGEAVERMATVAVGRLQALETYNAKMRERGTASARRAA